MINVLVTAIGGGGHGDQILKALLLSEEGRYKIFGADANPNCSQFSLVDAAAVLPFANSEDYIPKLFDLIERFEIRALFHGCEPELRLFAKYREEIEQRGVFLPINPSSVIDLCMDKELTGRTLQELGFDCPQFTVVKAKEDIAPIDWYPVVVKPSTGGGGSANVYIAQNRVELEGLAKYLNLAKGQIRFLVQEYVGLPTHEYTVGVLHDMDGNYVNSIAVRRSLAGQLNIRSAVPNRTGRRELGEALVISSGISQGDIGRFPEVTAQCKEIAAALGARGPINIQCRLVDGVVKVFEINPRFSGTTSLRALVGYNEPDILLRRHVSGLNVEPDFEFEEATIIRSLIEKKLPKLSK